MMIQINKPRLTIAALLAVCCLYLPQRVAAQSSLQISPNPASISVVIIMPGQFLHDSGSLILFNDAGKRIPARISKASTPIKYILDVRDLAPGLYYVRMTVGRVSGLGSFVKIN